MPKMTRYTIDIDYHSHMEFLMCKTRIHLHEFSCWGVASVPPTQNVAVRSPAKLCRVFGYEAFLRKVMESRPAKMSLFISFPRFSWWKQVGTFDPTQSVNEVRLVTGLQNGGRGDQSTWDFWWLLFTTKPAANVDRCWEQSNEASTALQWPAGRSSGLNLSCLNPHRQKGKTKPQSNAKGRAEPFQRATIFPGVWGSTPR